jgi:hypothetical protein
VESILKSSFSKGTLNQRHIAHQDSWTTFMTVLGILGLKMIRQMRAWLRPGPGAKVVVSAEMSLRKGQVPTPMYL